MLEWCEENSGKACFRNGPSGDAMGDEINGGILKLVEGLSPPLDTENVKTIRHELGHVFGLHHTYGDPDMMSGRDKTDDYTQLERDAFEVLYQLDVGLGLIDLMAIGVIDDDGDILNEGPQIYWTDSEVLTWDHVNHGAVGESIHIFGQRLTKAFSSECETSDFQRFGYSPPIVYFDSVSIVADLRKVSQTQTTGWPAGVLKIEIPSGAGVPLGLETRGKSVLFEAMPPDPPFFIFGDSVPAPDQTPKSVTNLSCRRDVGGSSVIQWHPPDQYFSGVRLNTNDVRTEIYRNGVLVDTLQGHISLYVDHVDHPAHEEDLYQLVVVHEATNQNGIPRKKKS